MKIFERMSPKSTTLRAGVGAVASVISKFVHPSKPLCDKYPNRTNNHKLQWVVLVDIDAKVVRRGANVILVFVFTHSDFSDQKFYVAKQYIHMIKEVEDDIIFVLSDTVVPAAWAGVIGPMSFDGKIVLMV